jgi:hypothetical protein
MKLLDFCFLKQINIQKRSADCRCPYKINEYSAKKWCGLLAPNTQWAIKGKQKKPKKPKQWHCQVQMKVNYTLIVCHMVHGQFPNNGAIQM